MREGERSASAPGRGGRRRRAMAVAVSKGVQVVDVLDTITCSSVMCLASVRPAESIQLIMLKFVYDFQEPGAILYINTRIDTYEIKHLDRRDNTLIFMLSQELSCW
jgi:hypothetical protein